MPEFTLRIDGMHCGSCVRRVSQALAATGGMVVNEVRLGAARVSSPQGDETPGGVIQDQAIVGQAIAALAKAGYRAHLEQ